MSGTLLITGASSGIGAEVAKMLSKTYRLVLCARDLPRLQNVLKDCNAGFEHLIFNCDLTCDFTEQFREFLAKNNLQISHFLHCAGVSPIMKASNFSESVLKQLFETNVFSAMKFVKILANKRVNNGALKAVVLMSSIAAHRGAKGYAFYAASKGALESYAKSLALELADTRINCLAPVAVRTPMSEIVMDFAKQADTQKICECKMEDVLVAVENLLSNSAQIASGETLIIEG